MMYFSNCLYMHRLYSCVLTLNLKLVLIPFIPNIIGHLACDSLTKFVCASQQAVLQSP
jgi:hypothetical protein